MIKAKIKYNDGTVEIKLVVDEIGKVQVIRHGLRDADGYRPVEIVVYGVPDMELASTEAMYLHEVVYSDLVNVVAVGGQVLIDTST